MYVFNVNVVSSLFAHRNISTAPGKVVAIRMKTTGSFWNKTTYKKHVPDSERCDLDRTRTGWYWLLVTGCSSTFRKE